MNILQILPELKVGGVETGTLDLANYLVKLGHKAVVVSSGGELVTELESAGVIHYQLPVHNKSVISIAKMIPRLVDIIRQEHIDVVHARSRVPAWIAYFACLITRTLFITTCHGYYQKHPFSRVMGWGKRVIVLSKVIGRHMIDNFAVPHERIKLIPRSVDLEKFKFISPDKKRGKEFNVGIVARITPLKGHLHFVKAMAKVARSVPRLKIWIVGDAPASRQAYKEQVQVLVKRLGLWQSTEFLGTQRDIPGIISHLDALVLATVTHEAFGRVIIEAQASGVPVVATKVGGVVDIIEDLKTGLLVPPADHSSIAEAVLKIFKDQKLASELAHNAYEKVKEKFNVELMVNNTLEVYRDAMENLKILIIKFSSLGDVVLSTAGLRAIREKFKSNHKISFLVGEQAKEVLLRCPYIDELLVSDFKNKDKGLKGFLNLAYILRKGNFDIVIDLQNNYKSHLLSFLSLGFDRYGYHKGKFSFLLNHRVKDEMPFVDPVTHQFRILKMLGIELEDHRLELWPTKEDQDYIEEFYAAEWLSRQQKIVGINMSASSRWLTKSWPLKQVVKLCEELGRRDIRVVITGSQDDSIQCNELAGTVKGTKVINACGKTTINQLACLIKKCSVFICVDSSPLHIASVVNTPFVALFGPTDHRRHMPQAKNGLLINKNLPCAPCYKTKCKTRECMESITPEEVLEAVDKLLR